MLSYRKMQWAVLLLLALTLSGCSSTQFGYRFLDELLRWKVDDYLSLDGQQGRDLDVALDRFFAWHQREQLPVYVQFLDQQIALLEQPEVTSAQLQTVAQKVQELLRASTRQLVPDVVRLLQTLDDEQITELLENYDQQAREYEEERILPGRDERHQDRIKRMRKLLGKWTGGPTEQQAERIAQWADQLSFETTGRLEQRRWFRSYFVKILEQRRQPQKLQAMLEQVMVYPDRQYMPAYRSYSDFNRQQTLQLLVDIHASLTPEQKRRLLAKLKQYRRDFLKLSQPVSLSATP